MAAEKYRTGFIDRCGKQCRIEIWEDSHTGGYTLLKTSGSPLKFDFDNESDDVFAPIRITQAVINLVSTANFSLIDLYSVEDMHFPVLIYIDDVLYFKGYIATRQYQEPYDVVPNIVSITAIDGLGLLKDIEYKNGEEYYNGRIRESQIILDILGKIGFTTFYEFCNIYEDSMLVSVDDSPMDQNFPDVDVFQDMSCYEVLIKLLTKYNAIIRQSYGAFYITRPVEMIGDSVAGRFFTGPTTKNSVTITPDQFIRRVSTHPKRTIRQVPNGILMVQSPAKKVTVNQDYGNKESLIDNWEFKGETFDGTDFDNWTQSAGTNARPVGANISDGNKGVYLDSYDTSSPYAYYIYQIFGANLKATTDSCVIEFDYLLDNFTGAPIADILVKAILQQDTFYLAGSGIWVSGLQGLTTNKTAEPGSSGWQHYKMDIKNGLLLSNTNIRIELQASNNANVRIAYKDIQFYFYSSETINRPVEHRLIKPKQRWGIWGYGLYKHWEIITRSIPFKEIRSILKKVYEKINPINGDEIELDYVFGDVVDTDIDNVLEQFAGAMATGTAQIRVDTITLTGNSGQCVPICNGWGGVCVYTSSLTVTAANYVTNYAASYLLDGIVLTSSGANLIYTSNILGFVFAGTTRITAKTGTLDGTVVYTTPGLVLYPTISWRTRAWGAGKELLQLICDEIADQYSRPKQLIQMLIMDTSGQMAINLLGNIQDTKNTLDGKARTFVINRGEFDVRNRIWNLDLFEIGTKDIVEDEVEPDGLITADMMLPTVDNTYITVDNG